MASQIWVQKICNWYGNHKHVTAEEPPIAQVGTVWHYRRVIQHLFKEEIAEKMKKSGLKSSDKGWIKKFQQAVTEVIDSKGGEAVVKKTYGKVAQQWNKSGLPEDLRRK